MSTAAAMTTRCRILFRDAMTEGGPRRLAAERLARVFAWRHWHKLEARRVWTFTPEMTVELVATGAAS